MKRLRLLVAMLALVVGLFVPAAAPATAISGHATGCAKSSWQYQLNMHGDAYCSSHDNNVNYNGYFRVLLTLYFPQQGGYVTYAGPWRLAGLGVQSNVTVACGVGYYACVYSGISIGYL